MKMKKNRKNPDTILRKILCFFINYLLCKNFFWSLSRNMCFSEKNILKKRMSRNLFLQNSAKKYIFEVRKSFWQEVFALKILVIPDVHLKPYMFEDAGKLMERLRIEKAVCLMDIADDWGKQFYIDLYQQTYDAAIEFARKYPETLWCYGNHDMSYVWQRLETGYSRAARYTVVQKLGELERSLPDPSRIGFIHRIDNILFSHGGIGDYFAVKNHLDDPDIDSILETVNSFGEEEMWQDDSPLWYRPQYYRGEMFRQESFWQVVGHTPTDKIQIDRKRKTISCDVFSTRSDGVPIGTRQFLLIDTEKRRYKGVSI